MASSGGRGLRFGKVNEILLRWRITRTEHLAVIPGTVQMPFCVVEAHFLASGPLAEAERIVVWGAGREGGKLARLMEDEGVRVAAFIDVDPRKDWEFEAWCPGDWVRGFKELFGLSSGVLCGKSWCPCFDTGRVGSTRLHRGLNYWCVL